ncbi:MAG: aconitate hydratase AcnA [Chloroflexota bacterium]
MAKALPTDPLEAGKTLTVGSQTYYYYDLNTLAAREGVHLDQLPFTVKILLENVLRHCDGKQVREEEVLALARWAGQGGSGEYPFLPSRVLLQDFTGVPAVVDLAAMRSAMSRLGGDPKLINPLVPVDLVIDHSVQVDVYGTVDAFDANVDFEYRRNAERYALLRWAQQAFLNFRVASPGMGIVHQVNLEFLASVVTTRQEGGMTMALPDTLVGTDSHTTMVNGLGVLGWGVGGIEAEAAMLGQPFYLPWPQVVGVRLAGKMREGTTATDLVLTVTQMLRRHGVVNKFVEFTGPGLQTLSLADRATVSNMSPEYGATASVFPVDEETLRYLRDTGRDKSLVDLVAAYTQAQGMFSTANSPEPTFTERLELDLGSIEPSLAGPARPQDRVPLGELKNAFRAAFPKVFIAPEQPVDDPTRFDWEGGSVNEAQEPTASVTGVAIQPKQIEVEVQGTKSEMGHGSVAIAAITSCTNTSNPAVMMAAGLIAKHAVERGLTVKPYVKTSLAPGSIVVTDYLKAAGLMPYLEALRFHLVGYGCTTCIGNSGPLPESVAFAVQDNSLVVAAVLSGNRNFEGRIHPQVRASYLASPPLVVAYALAGTIDIDLENEPLGQDTAGQPVFLRDLWPTSAQIQEAIVDAIKPEMYRETYERVFVGDERWQRLPVPAGDLYAWDEQSTYVKEPPYFVDLSTAPGAIGEIRGARVLAVLGDSVTTDHISPAGSIPAASPAGQHLIGKGVEPRDFNSYGSRRGNHEIMMRGTFGNIRLRNALVAPKEGYWTVHQPSNQEGTIYEVSCRYQDAGTPLVVLAGKEYGSGSSRDWAAKGPMMLGIKAVIAESYERIHRANLVGMGVLPLQYRQGENAASLGLTGRETFDIVGLGDDLRPRQDIKLRATREDGGTVEFQALVRIDIPIEIDYYRHGGVLPYVLRRLMQTGQDATPA